MKNFSTCFFLLIIPFLISTSFKTFTNAGLNFPVPAKTDDLLFYLQRTVNTNTIIYELNKDSHGEIIPEEPIKINWIKYAEDSSREDLSYIQRAFAYGIESKIADRQKKSFILKFVSYKKKDLYLIKSVYDNKYHAYMYINDKLTILDKIFIQIEGGTFWFPNIQFVEVSGKSPRNSENISERINP